MSQKGNEILLALRSQFAATRTVETLRKIEIPESGHTIYYWSEMSMAERRAIYAPVRPSSGRGLSPAELLEASRIQVLIRSRDEHGTRLFDDANDAALDAIDPDIIMRIAHEMGWGSGSAEDAEKN